MLLGLRVTVLLSHAEVDQMNVVRIGLAGPTDQEVVRLDITVDQIMRVQVLDQSNHLHSDLDNSFHGELPAAPVEQVLQGGAQKVNYQDVVQALLTEVVRVWDIGRPVKNLVGFVFVSQLRSLSLPGLELDRDRHAVDHVGTFEEDTERALAYFFTDLVVQPDNGRVVSGGVAVGVDSGCGSH